MKKNRILSLGISLIAVLSSTQALALNVQLFRPSTGHYQGFQVETSETLPQYNLAGGLIFNLAHHPLELTLAGSTSRQAGVVDRFVTADFLLSYGAFDWLTLNVDMPLNIYHDIAPTLIPTRDQGGGDAGDLLFDAKLQVFDANKTATHLGLALVPFITLPTGDQDIFFGDTNVTGGATVVGDGQFGANRVYLNVGAKFREKEQVANLNPVADDELTYGLGFQRPIVKKWDLDGIAEVFGSTTFRKFATENISSPLEGLVTLRKKWLENKQLVTNVGGGGGITNGYGTPTFRVVAGVAYAWDLTPKKPEPTPEFIPVEGKINFDFDKAVIKPESYAVLDDVLEKIRKLPPDTAIQIEGHTDSKGTEEYNQSLSQRRAQVVKDYFIKNGIEADRLTTVGYGELKPIATNDTDEGRAMNRRTEFRVVR